MDSDHPALQSDMKSPVMGFILSISALFIISINLLVAAALLKLLLKRGCQSWCFVLNLALADTLVGVAVTGLATEDFKNVLQHRNGHFIVYPPTNATPPVPQGKTRCLLRMAFMTSPCIASILSMFLISLDRYVAIKMPLRYSLMSGKGKTAASLLVVWISSFTMGFLPGESWQTLLYTLKYTDRRMFDNLFLQSESCVIFSVSAHTFLYRNHIRGLRWPLKKYVSDVNLAIG